MAFGKDPKLAAIGGSFRQSAQLHSKSRVVRAPRGRVPYFVEQFQPSLTIQDVVRLIPGAYAQEQAVGEGDDVIAQQYVAQYIQFSEHYLDARKKSCICSAGVFKNIKNKRGACRGCDIYWETAARNPKNNFFESKVISNQRKYAISVLDYSKYHKIEQIDRDSGQVRINQRTNEPYFNWVKCQGQGCDGCRAGKETKVGDARHWPMSPTHFQVLLAAELNIGKSCARCGTADFTTGESPIKSLAWSCRSCGTPAIDMATTTLKTDEILAITDKPFDCPDCGQASLLEEQIVCVECAKRGQQGVRAGLFDVDMRVQLTDTGQMARILQVSGWSNPRPIPEQFLELAKPVDLLEKFAPDSIEYQTSCFGAPSAPTPQGRAPVPVATTTAPQYTQYAPKN